MESAKRNLVRIVMRAFAQPIVIERIPAFAGMIKRKLFIRAIRVIRVRRYLPFLLPKSAFICVYLWLKMPLFLLL